MADTVWKLQDHEPTLHVGQIDATVRGFTDINRCGGHTLPKGAVSIFDVSFAPLLPDKKDFNPAARTEMYIRGDDLVATFEQPWSRPLRSQVYRRALHPETLSVDLAKSDVQLLGGIEVVASVQTSLLDADPSIVITSHVSADSYLRWDQASQSYTSNPGAGRSVLAKIAPRMWYLEIGHPNNWCDSESVFEFKRKVQSQHWLFRGRLEKGVILRARIRGLFLEGDDDAIPAAATALYDQFAATDPPLTT